MTFSDLYDRQGRIRTFYFFYYFYLGYFIVNFRCFACIEGETGRCLKLTYKFSLFDRLLVGLIVKSEKTV